MARKSEMEFIDGEKVRERLDYLGVYQKDLAYALGLTERHLSRCLVKEEMTMANIYKIAAITNLSIDELTDSQFELLGPNDIFKEFLFQAGATIKSDAKYTHTRMDELHWELRMKECKDEFGVYVPYTEILFHAILQYCDLTDYEFQTYPKDSIQAYLELIAQFVKTSIIKPHRESLSPEQRNNIARLEHHGTTDKGLYLEEVPERSHDDDERSRKLALLRNDKPADYDPTSTQLAKLNPLYMARTEDEKNTTLPSALAEHPIHKKNA